MAAYDQEYDPNNQYLTKPLNPNTAGPQMINGQQQPKDGSQPPAYADPNGGPSPFDSLGPNGAFPAQPASPTKPAGPAAAPMGAMPAGIDPALAAIYQKAGVNPADRGSGFADWQYWQGVGPSQYDRLARNLAGNGPDQPTGTPGTGAWSTSGGGAGAAGGGVGAYKVGQGVAGQGTVFGADNPLSGQQNALFKTLMDRAGQSLNIDGSDPIIKNQTDAFNATQQRSERNFEQQMAERLGANSNMDADRRVGAERIGQNTSQFEAQLIGQERTARRNEIQSALSGSQGLLTTEQQMQLQEELAQLNMAQSAYQFDSNDQFRNSPLGSSAG